MKEARYAPGRVALATKHHKEKSVGPPFHEYLGATLVVADIDTDALGTFSGEVSRLGGALETAIRKCRLGMEAVGLACGVASEGSFGPHPLVPFLPADQELLVYIDDERGLQLHECLLSEATNFAHASVNSVEEAEEFFRNAGFPDHGCIVRPNVWEDRSVLFKDIRDRQDWLDAFDACKLASADGRVWLETDMRAHRNPSRMRVIGALAEKLARRLATACPACGAPGWGRTAVEKGLNCEACGTETEMVKAEVFTCCRCDYRESLPRNDGLLLAPPCHCPYCNP